LALARKFIILDLKETTPNELLGLAVVTLALGITYWLLRERDDRLGLNESATGESIRFKAPEVFLPSHTLIQTTQAQLL
jgi:uncharacterized membrane protein (DUF373 family)